MPTERDPSRNPIEASAAERFARLVEIMRTLRSPEGCPWDRAQTLQTLAPFVLEETYEVLDAIERGDLDDLKGEVGDLIFEGVFLAQLAAEQGAFSVGDALDHVVRKLVRRHPHVFRDDGRVHDADSRARAPSADAALGRWDAEKAKERREQGQPDDVLAGVPRSLPALLRAYKIGKRAAATGFDWPTTADVVDKVEEEVSELRQAVAENDAAHVEEEIGDLLFSLANLCRKLGVEPEAALRRATDKFTARFTTMERRFDARGERLADATLERMENEWRAVKAQPRS